jgi:hypothetical protein
MCANSIPGFGITGKLTCAALRYQQENRPRSVIAASRSRFVRPPPDQPWPKAAWRMGMSRAKRSRNAFFTSP